MQHFFHFRILVLILFWVIGTCRCTCIGSGWQGCVTFFWGGGLEAEERRLSCMFIHTTHFYFMSFDFLGQYCGRFMTLQEVLVHIRRAHRSSHRNLDSRPQFSYSTRFSKMPCLFTINMCLLMLLISPPVKLLPTNAACMIKKIIRKQPFFPYN